MQRDEIARRAEAAHLRVAIDGPSGAGKSTLGRSLAQALGCCYLDTGLMYRAVTAAALRSSVSLDDQHALGRLAESMDFDLAGSEGSGLVVDGRPAGDDLRTAEIDTHVSRVSAVPAVRHAMVERQRSLASGRCFVMVGRDIGTTVLPDADVKIWVTASPEERAKRRLSEHLRGSGGVTLQEMAAQIRERDALDSNRVTSPLRRPADAVTLDTDFVSPAEAVDRALEIVGSALSSERATLT